MKLLLAMLLAVNLYAASGNPFTKFIDTSSTNLTNTFPATPQLLGPPAGKFYKVDGMNTSSYPIVVNCSEASQPSSSSLNVDDVVIPGNVGYTMTALTILPNPLLNNCWARALSGTISSGYVELVGYGY